ncbi:energy-coupling factor transporter ATP-binding protein EcfA2 [Microbacterium testaceum]|nr:energy-coupling factor transporter ATP-binding protein EcfA2 [Microbacterium testaceum]
MRDPARVDVEGWGWRYAGRRLPATREVDLVIEPGERVLLLGASGAGKSTLLAGLAGLLGGADEGEVSGRILVDGGAPEAQRGRIGLVLQDPEAGIVLSKVGDDVAFGCENLGVPATEIPARVAEALASVGLAVPLDRPTKALSGGQKQRLALAGVLAMRPGLLLLDEPTANLDPEGVAEVRRAIERVVAREGTTLVLIEHRTAVWADLMTRVVVLAPGGGVLADGPPDRVFAEHGDALAAAGVWVPQRPVDLPVLEPASTPDVVLRASALSTGRERHTVVASGLDLALPRGAGTVITGPNGGGKSTLALTLAGLLPELAGEVVAAEELSGARGSPPLSLEVHGAADPHRHGLPGARAPVPRLDPARRARRRTPRSAQGAGRGRPHRRRTAGASRSGIARACEPVHAVGRPEETTVGGHGARRLSRRPRSR